MVLDPQLAITIAKIAIQAVRYDKTRNKITFIIGTDYFGAFNFDFYCIHSYEYT